jgi:hypothetical protein
MYIIIYGSKNMAADDLTHVIHISSNVTRKHCHESALRTAAHILICPTQEGKSIEEIARRDFDNNLKLVTVWVDYMAAVNWMHNNNIDVDSKNR